MNAHEVHHAADKPTVISGDQVKPRHLIPAPVIARPRSTIRPLRVVTFDKTMAVKVMHGYGHRASCSCEWVGPVRRTVQAALADKRQHDAEHGDTAA